MKRFEILKAIGYGETVNTNKAVEDLKARGTKVAAKVAEKIEASAYYQIFTNGTDFAVNAQSMVTKQEQAQLKKVLGGEIKEVSAIADQNGYWAEWIDASDKTEIEIVEETEEKDEIEAELEEVAQDVAARGYEKPALVEKYRELQAVGNAYCGDLVYHLLKKVLKDQLEIQTELRGGVQAAFTPKGETPGKPKGAMLMDLSTKREFTDGKNTASIAYCPGSDVPFRVLKPMDSPKWFKTQRGAEKHLEQNGFREIGKEKPAQGKEKSKTVTKYVVKQDAKFLDASGISGLRGHYRLVNRPDASTFPTVDDAKRYANKWGVEGYELRPVQVEVMDSGI